MSDKETMAFPHSFDDSEEGRAGMTLRDYFAAKVLQGMVVNAGRNGLLPLDATNKGAKEKAATLAYEFADKMMEARDAS